MIWLRFIRLQDFKRFQSLKFCGECARVRIHFVAFFFLRLLLSIVSLGEFFFILLSLPWIQFRCAIVIIYIFVFCWNVFGSQTHCVIVVLFYFLFFLLFLLLDYGLLLFWPTNNIWMKIFKHFLFVCWIDVAADLFQSCTYKCYNFLIVW